MPRVYERKFDWDEARRRHAAGESTSAIARSFGVSVTAVSRAVNPAIRERMDRTLRSWQSDSRCPDCGKQTWKREDGREARCVSCAAKLKVTTARSDTLQCVTCKEWKPDEAFPRSAAQPARRGRHRQCTPCGTKARTDWRRRNRDRENAYQREYKKRNYKRRTRATDHN